MPDGPRNAHEFYRHAIKVLTDADIAFLVGGGYALGYYTGIERESKDFDIFVRAGDYATVMEALSREGYHTELTFPHWLGKASCDHAYLDVIFNSGNGVVHVDDAWFQHAARGEALGLPVRFCPVEEMIWAQAYIMERERYDGADIMHLILARAQSIDWARLIMRFADHWRVLLAHLCLFGFIYPSERNCIPQWVMNGLIGRLDRELRTPPPQAKTCQGTLLSREQYLTDVKRWGLCDARHGSASSMTPDDVALWTQAIEDNKNT